MSVLTVYVLKFFARDYNIVGSIINYGMTCVAVKVLVIVMRFYKNRIKTNWLTGQFNNTCWMVHENIKYFYIIKHL